MSKKTISKVLALALATTLALTGCGQSSSNKPASGSNKPIKDLVITKGASRELETFNWLYSQRAEDTENLTNLVDGLLEVNTKGQLVPCIAEKWGTEDSGKTWTFNIRKDVKWVDVNGAEKADCNAYDFATGLEWVLNFHKNDSNNTAMPIEMVKGAKEYYEYTKALSPEEAFVLTSDEGSKFREMVGIKTPDEYTVVYECIVPTPYFDTLGNYFALYPMSQAMVNELGIEGAKSMDNTKMWYNGCYTMTTYTQGNEKIFTKNPMYWDKDCYLFDTVTFRMVDGGDITYQLYEAGECDYCGLTESVAKTIIDNPDHKFHNYIVPDVPSKHSYQIHFNYDKRFKDGSVDENWNKAVANKAFRQAFYYGVELGDYYRRTNILDPYSCQNNFYLMQGTCFLSDGTDYTDIVREKLNLPADSNEKMIRFNKDKALELKEQAIKELTAIGVTFPVQYDHYIKGGSQPALDSAKVLKHCIESTLGSDFITVNINEFVSSLAKEVRKPQLASGYGNGWGLDYGDPINSLGQETLHNDNAWYANNYAMTGSLVPNDYNADLIAIMEEYTNRVNKAHAITDNLDERYKAFADAEAYLIENAIVIPQNLGKGLALSKIDNSSKMHAMYGSVNEKMKNWVTNQDGYTTEDAKSWYGSNK